MTKENQKLEEPQKSVEANGKRFCARKTLDIIKERPIIYCGIGALPIICLLCYSCGLWAKGQISAQTDEYQPRESRQEFVGVKQAVDPRAKWTEEVVREVKNMQNQLEELINSKYSALEQKYHATENHINEVKQKLQALEKHNEHKFNDINGRISPTSNQPSLSVTQTKSTQLLGKEVANVVPQQAKLLHITRVSKGEKKNTKDYITTGSFARAVLLTGTVVGTGTNSASTPEPIILRLVDTAIFSKGYKTPQIKEAILIGSCTGDISSERAKCRIETISLVNSDGDIIEKQVEGWLIGEDGRPGIKGVVVDKSSDVARMAILNGVLGSIAKFFQSQASRNMGQLAFIPGVGQLVSQQQNFNVEDQLKAGVYTGAGNAFDKLADFAIKRADSMNPVIVVNSGRVIDVVFKKGFALKLLNTQKNVNHNKNSTQSSNDAMQSTNLYKQLEQSLLKTGGRK